MMMPVSGPPFDGTKTLSVITIDEPTGVGSPFREFRDLIPVLTVRSPESRSDLWEFQWADELG